MCHCLSKGKKTTKIFFLNLVQVEFYRRYASGSGTPAAPKSAWRGWLCFSPTHRGKPPAATSCFKPFPPPFHVLLPGAEMLLGNWTTSSPTAAFSPGDSESLWTPSALCRRVRMLREGGCAPSQRGRCRFWIVLVVNLLCSCYKCN